MTMWKLRAIDFDYRSRVLEQRRGGGLHDACFSRACRPEEQEICNRPARWRIRAARQPTAQRQDRQYGHGTGQRRVRCQNAQVKRF